MSKSNKKLVATGKNEWESKDERIPKIIGMALLLLAAYLFVAFISYIFTWKEDQDKVLRFSWSLLLESDLSVENWLGRLGAIVSNLFFYWGFGVPSFILVYLSYIYGIALLKQQPVDHYRFILRKSLITMLVLSIFLAFVFKSFDFPWGGTFGNSINFWMTNFIGNIGMVLLFVFVGIGLITWAFNPNYQEVTVNGAKNNTLSYVKNLFTGKIIPDTTVENKASSSKKSDFEIDDTTIDSKNIPTSEELPKKRNSLAMDILGESQEFDIQSATPKPTANDSDDLEIISPVFEPIAIDDNVDEDPLPPTDHNYKPIDNAVIEEGDEDIQSNLINAQGLYDPTLELSGYEMPNLTLLNDYSDQKIEIDRAELETNKDQIINTLRDYKIEITKIRATVGPTVTLYEIIPAPGVRIAKIKNLEDDIALNLAALGIRIIAPIPGRGTIGIEVPNKNKQMVSLKEVFLSEKFKKSTMDLPIALGKTISNEVFVADLTKMPHLLIAGATGQGKSVGINTILMSLLFKQHPAHVKLILIDPKKVELFPYSAIENHFLGFLPDQLEPIVTDTTKVIHTLSSLCVEMDNRYSLLQKASVRTIKEYNEKFTMRQLNPKKGHQFLPFIVLIIDEFADLIMTAGKEIELPIGRLAQLSRAVGIHLIIATQRPSVNIITGVIKANFPARLAFKVSSKVDSRTILDGGGADQLIGRGDMLLSLGGDMVRLQCAFVDTPEVEKVINFIAKQKGYSTPFFLPEYAGNEESANAKAGFSIADIDEYFEDAARLVVQNQTGSTSMIQRRLKLGYNRAGRIMDQLEAVGIVGPSEGSKPRDVLVVDEYQLEKYLQDLKSKS